MAEVAANKWEFSLLVDQASRILEARGLFELYLGAPAHQLAGKTLVSYFDPEERLGFLRYMAKLLVRGEAEPVAATLHTPALGSKRFSMAAREGEPGHAWWLMFSQEGKNAAAAPDLASAEQPFASEHELSAITAAHDHEKTPLDLTVFRAAALSPEHPMPLPESERVALDDKLGESLLHHAHERLVTRPAMGEYALLHGRNKSAAEIGKHLASVAIRHNVPEQQLGLSHATQNVEPETAAADVIRETRRKLKEQAAQAPSSFTTSMAFKVSAWIGGGSIAFVLLVWFFVRISH